MALTLSCATPRNSDRKPAGDSEISIENLTRTVTYLSSPELNGRAPGSSGHAAAKNYIIDRLKEYGYSARTLTTKRKLGVPIENLYTVLPGAPSASGHCIALAAHYDHNGPIDHRYSPGANDNATGVAGLLEIARVLRSRKEIWPADIYILFPDYEEAFISGSPYLAEALKKQCTQVLFTVTYDMIGVPFFPGFEQKLLALGAESNSALDSLVERTSKDPGSDLSVIHGPIRVIEPFGIARSDYKSFRKAKMPILFLTTGMPATYHTYADKVESVDFELVKNSTGFLLKFLNDFRVSAASDTGKTLLDGLALGYRKPSSDSRAGALGIAEVLAAMKTRPSENALTAMDLAWIDRKIESDRNLSDPPSFAALQFQVVHLLGIVARQSPVKASYLKSFVDKLERKYSKLNPWNDQ
jgi:hypothetical protein